MRRIGVVVGLLALLCSGGVARGQQAQTALVDHFEQLAEIIPGQNYRVLRMDLDLTGDGVPDLLLAPIRPDGQSGTPEWFVYQNLGNQQYRFLDFMDFSFLLFRIDDKGQLVLFDKDLGSLFTYSTTSSGFQQVSVQNTVDIGGPEWQKFADWRKTVGLRVLATSLSDAETNPTPQWTDIIANKPAPGVGGLSGLVVVP